MQVAGLHLCVVPIEREASPTLYFVLGPSLVGRRGEPDDYIALAKEFDIRIDQWMEALQEIKIFSHVGINSVASLLDHLAEFVFPRKQMAFLERLLDASLQAVHAEAGSVLISGQGSEELFIQVARGLKPEVVRSARIRVGEGLAGIAAAERTPLRVNRQTEDLRIQQAMQRPEVEDAMVVPMTRGSQLLGVLCVNRSRGGPPLREDGIALLQQFAGLAQEALS
jgi:GAF domain-containing protein